VLYLGKNCHDFCDCNDCCFQGKDTKDEKCDFVKDRVCCCWSVPKGHSQDVYVVVGGLNVFASGTISFDCGDHPFITVTFFNGNTPLSSHTVVNGSCLTFTAANFTRIQVTCPANASTDDVCSGKICVTPRYQIKCDNDNNHGCC
jgi:hypothetical protein